MTRLLHLLKTGERETHKRQLSNLPSPTLEEVKGQKKETKRTPESSTQEMSSVPPLETVTHRLQLLFHSFILPTIIDNLILIPQSES